MRKWAEKRQFIYYLVLLPILIFCISGCGGPGEKDVSSGSGQITLLEPVGAAAEYEEAAYRNLYQVKVYSAAVFPCAEEYTFSDAATFSQFTAFPGEKVNKGDVLAKGDTSFVQGQIETMEETVRSLEESFQEYREAVLEAIEKPSGELQNLKNIVEAYKKAEPGEEEPGFTQWKKEFTEFEGRYRILAHSTDTLRLQLEQRTQLYELDHAWYEGLLEELKKELQQNAVSAGQTGEVMAIAPLKEGESVAENQPVAAVGDRERKVIKCEYISQTAVAQAEDVYALIDGIRYEVSYQPVAAEIYTELSAQGETVYTAFELQGAGEEVQAGDFAVIVVMAARKEQTLSIPKSAIHKDESGYYVHVLKGKESVYTPVKTGMSDGVYTEILSGLESREKVLYGETQKQGQNTAEVTMGSFSSDFKGSGYMYYPSYETIKNPVEYGTVYYLETKAALYQYVEEGDVLALIRVQPDEIELKRQRQKLIRLEERLRDMENGGGQEGQKAIEKKKKEIEDLRQLIADMEEDEAVTRIYASRSGIVTAITPHASEDILKPGEALMEIADKNTCYVVVENTNQLLCYGNEVTINFQDLVGNEKNAQGTVVNLSQMGISKRLRSEYSMVLLPPEIIGEMSVATQAQEGWWNRNLFEVSAVIRRMDNVLVLPKKAVTEVNGSTYVHVLEEDGTVTARSFVAGGYNDTSYWVIEGLAEGMKVCLE